MIGRVVQNYKIISLIGEGGMGSVYKALDFKLDRYVAIKVLHLNDQRNTTFVERFKLEAKNQAKLSHPNIVSVYGFVEARDFLGFVMELIEGKTVEEYLLDYGRLSLNDSIQILKQALIGTAYAHTEGFIHRDLKPSNIIIDTKGVVKITDFGIAKSVNETISITKSGAKVGTVLYMSPEQIRGFDPTVKSDLYSLAVTFYEMISGKVPYNFNSEYEILDAHLNNIPAPLSEIFPEIPPQVDAVIIKAMNKAVSGNYKHCTDFLYELEILEAQLADINYQDNRSYNHIEISSPIKNSISKRVFNFFLFLVFISLLVFSAKVVTDYLLEQREKEAQNQENTSISTGPFSEVRSEWKLLDTGIQENINSVLNIGQERVLLFGNNGTIIQGNIRGREWVKIDNPEKSNIHSAVIISPRQIVAVGDNGTILLSSNGGSRWIKMNSGTKSALFNIKRYERKLIVVGTDGTIIESNDSGLNWIKLKSPTDKIIYDIHPFDKSNLIITGWGGLTFRTSNNGVSWEKININTDSYIRSIDFSNEGVGIAVGGGGKIFRSNDKGITWKIVNSNTISALNKVRFINNTSVLVTGNKGEILLSSDAGQNWELLLSGVFSNLTDINLLADGNVVITGSNGTVLTTIMK